MVIKAEASNFSCRQAVDTVSREAIGLRSSASREALTSADPAAAQFGIRFFHLILRFVVRRFGQCVLQNGQAFLDVQSVRIPLDLPPGKMRF
jgi:hypothetical protein